MYVNMSFYKLSQRTKKNDCISRKNNQLKDARLDFSSTNTLRIIDTEEENKSNSFAPQIVLLPLRKSFVYYKWYCNYHIPNRYPKLPPLIGFLLFSIDLSIITIQPIDNINHFFYNINPILEKLRNTTILIKEMLAKNMSLLYIYTITSYVNIKS